MIKKFNEFRLNEELDFKMIPTKFTKINIPGLFISNVNDTIYRFTSNNGNSYDLYFSLTDESDSILDDGVVVKNMTTDYVPTIFFSLTDRGLDVDIFNKLTNNGEKFEVMGKIIFLIHDFMFSNKYKLYTVGEVEDKKYKFYMNYLHNLSGVSMMRGTSNSYNGEKAYYLIKI